MKMAPAQGYYIVENPVDYDSNIAHYNLYNDINIAILACWGEDSIIYQLFEHQIQSKTDEDIIKFCLTIPNHHSSKISAYPFYANNSGVH